MKYTVVDLMKIKDELGEHWNPREKDLYTGRCSECNEAIAQFEDRCAICDTPVVWRGSKHWRQMYGQPSPAENLLLRTPSDLAGIDLVAAAGVKAFPTPSALVRWEHIIETMSQLKLQSIVSRCHNSLRGKKNGLRGLIPYVLNSCEKFIREHDTPASEHVEEIFEYGGM